MTQPTYPLDHPTAASLVADKPFNEARARQFRNSFEHVRSVLYDPATHVPARLHDHDGINSALIQLPGPNLVERASINASSEGGEWIQSGATYGAKGGDAGAHFGASGSYIGKLLANGDLDGDECVRGGARLTVSMFAKLSATFTPYAGKVYFGITDATAFVFATGCRAVIDEARLTTTYQRFYFSCLTPDVAADPYFRATCVPGFTNDIIVDCVAVTLGPRLGWWHPADSDPIHYYYSNISQNVPCWDFNIGMADAIQLVPS